MYEDIQWLLKKRQLSSDPENTVKWEVRESEISGRGVFARTGILTGEVVFKESPLVIGPRAVPLPAACVSCLKLGLPLAACPLGCRLPLCGSEDCLAKHRPECGLLRSRLPRLKEGEHWSPLLYRALVPVRCLLLSRQEKAIISQLSQNTKKKHVEMMLLKEELSEEVSPEDESFLSLCCRVLDSVAFEMELDMSGPSVSWRGLYPLAGSQNHSCRPNTQYSYEPEEVRMVVVATELILVGQEITTNYCPLLWSTTARRHFLKLTKEFLCQCQRCADPTEFGSYFSAHGCSCGGYLMPVGSEAGSDWRCGRCGSELTAKEVLASETAMLRGALPTHKNSYIAVQRKLNLVNAIGRPKHPYKVASDTEMLAKEKAIRDIMDINDRLQLGRSRLKISLEEELRDTLDEINRRKSQNNKG